VELWLQKLEAGDRESAWDAFALRYQRLMMATIRRLVPERDDSMDVYSIVCAALVAADFRRLRQYAERPEPRPGVVPWLVAVVRNLTIDWVRGRDGRRRLAVPEWLSPEQRRIFVAVCVEGHSAVEAYELIRARTASSQSFPEFLRDVREVRRAAPCPEDTLARRRSKATTTEQLVSPVRDPVQDAELLRRIASALGTLPADVRLAVELFVVDRLPAARVASVVGWPNPKTVYNRVYRALEALRSHLERDGIEPGDLA
jgi:RNA polymerase sigma factor (sigma-70 family)